MQVTSIYSSWHMSLLQALMPHHNRCQAIGSHHANKANKFLNIKIVKVNTVIEIQYIQNMQSVPLQNSLARQCLIITSCSQLQVTGMLRINIKSTHICLVTHSSPILCKHESNTKICYTNRRQNYTCSSRLSTIIPNKSRLAQRVAVFFQNLMMPYVLLVVKRRLCNFICDPVDKRLNFIPDFIPDFIAY